RGVVIGDGPELPAGRSLAAELALDGGGCEFLGERHDLPRLLAAADFLVLCSEDEGSPNVVLEGMAAGLPIVTTPAGAAQTIGRPASAGLIVPFGDVDALAEAMSRLAADPSLRRASGSAGRDMVRRQFSPTALVDRLFRVYRSVAQIEGDERALGLLSAYGH